MAAKLWHKYSWLFHILTTVLTIGIIWGTQDTTVKAQGTDIQEIKAEYRTVSKDVGDMKSDISSIKESLKWIEKRLK